MRHLAEAAVCGGEKVLSESKVIGTDDTSMSVLNRNLPFARSGRIWPYYGEQDHPVTPYDYTPTRSVPGRIAS